MLVSGYNNKMAFIVWDLILKSDHFILLLYRNTQDVGGHKNKVRNVL
jgi:hypothetical protein